MKRLAALLVLVTACASTRSAGTHHRMGFAAPQSSVDTNQLRVFKGTPPAPASGTVAIISNDGTSLLQQNSDGTTSTLGGGGSSLPSGTGIVKVTSGTGSLAVAGTDYDVPLTDEQLALSDAVAKLGSCPAGKRWIVIPTPLAYTSGVTWAVAGTSGTSGTVKTDQDGPVVVVDSSASASHAGIFHVNNTGVSYVANARTSKWLGRWRVKLGTAVDAQAAVTWGFRPAGNVATTPAIQFGFTGSQSTTNWSWDTIGSGAATGVTSVAIDNGFHTLEEVNDATTLHFNLDGTDVATTPSTSIDPSAMTIVADTFNGTTAASRQNWVASMVFVGCGV